MYLEFQNFSEGRGGSVVPRRTSANENGRLVFTGKPENEAKEGHDPGPPKLDQPPTAKANRSPPPPPQFVYVPLLPGLVKACLLPFVYLLPLATYPFNHIHPTAQY